MTDAPTAENQTRGFTPRLEFIECPEGGFVAADAFGCTWAEGDTRYEALVAWHRDAERVRSMLEAAPKLHQRMLRQLRFLQAAAGVSVLSQDAPKETE